MSHFDLVYQVFSALVQSVHLSPFLALGSTPITIQEFFTSLYGKLTAIALAVSTFFFAWAALLYSASGTGNERSKQHAQAALYAALLGLALALIAGVVAGLISDAATGN